MNHYFSNMKRSSLLFTAILTLISSLHLHAQIIPTSSYKRLEAFIKRKEAKDTTWFGQVPLRNIGPTVFSGRVTDIAVNPDNPWEFYVAYASGGLWYTNNNGVSFTPLFQQEAVMTIGAIAVDWRSRTVWVGTGEVNSSRSSYAGVGIYKGEVGQDNWQLMGLQESQHIGKILLHPKDTNRVTVAVMGPLYSKSSNRGIFQTRDGGVTWKRMLYVNDSTGCVDLVADPVNPDIMFAAAWQRDRKAWNFIESGKYSGIYRTMNGGLQWKRVTVDTSGFPYGEGVGRIGLQAIMPDSQLVLYALLDNQNLIPEDKAEDDALSITSFRTMSEKDFLELDNKELNAFLKKNGFPKKYNANSVKQMVENGEIEPDDLADYLEDANMRLLNGKVYGAELYVSRDNGITWEKTHEDHLAGVYNTYGYYFGLVRVTDKDPNTIYISGVPILRSDDGGVNFTNINGENVHVDHHALWVNPRRPEHLILGNDGGINISYDKGKNWIKCNSPEVGQFYSIQADLQDTYWVYGGTQDNGVWAGPHNYRPGNSWHQTGQYPYKRIMGGDGMQVQIDTRDHRYVYTGFQFGNYFRIDNQTGKRTYITPKHELGERPYRWNWETPILLSPHNQDILYMGSNFLHRSMDKGENFEKISPDLTSGGLPGDVPFGTITTIDESPFQFGLLYAGTDDGLIHVSRDAGSSWTCISGDLPVGFWVSHIVASKHKKERVYVALNGYRNDHFLSYIFKSEDYGSTWEPIGEDLPEEPVNVIKEDPKREGLIYVGSDHQTYISLDDGVHFMTLNKSMPDVAVHDLLPHPREDDLIIGTHGRSLYIADISRIRDFDEEYLDIELSWYPVDTVKYRQRQGEKRAPYADAYRDSLVFETFCGLPGINTFQVISQDGATLLGIVLDMKKGYNRWAYYFDVTPRGKINWEELNSGKNIEKAPFYEGQDGNFYLKKGKYKMILRHETGLKLERELILTD